MSNVSPLQMPPTIITALLIALASSSAHGQHDDILDTFTSIGGKDYAVKLQQRTAAALGSVAFRKYGHWGAEGRSPSFCISALQLTRQNQLVGISAKHYVDLCNVSRLWFTEKSPYVILTIEGGDASDSFRAEFKIHGVNIVERTVRDGEFPQVYERTRFSYPFVSE